jgi:hypothetical protein
MPKMHRFELYRQMRKTDNKVIFFTASETYYEDLKNLNQRRGSITSSLGE